MTPFEELEQEFAYTTYADSCKEPAVVGGELRECRRALGHTPHTVHASGFGQDMMIWSNQ